MQGKWRFRLTILIFSAPCIVLLRVALWCRSADDAETCSQNKSSRQRQRNWNMCNTIKQVIQQSRKWEKQANCNTVQFTKKQEVSKVNWLGHNTARAIDQGVMVPITKQDSILSVFLGLNYHSTSCKLKCHEKYYKLLLFNTWYMFWGWLQTIFDCMRLILGVAHMRATIACS